MESRPTETGPFRLLFVCTGNTCRSPLAEVIAKRRLTELGWNHVEVRSAGVAAFPNSDASEGALRAARAHGLDLTGHGSTLLTREVAESADLILAMSAAHVARIDEFGVAECAAVITTFAYDLEAGALDPGVPDPFGGPDEGYVETFDVLDDLVRRVLARLQPVLSP